MSGVLGSSESVTITLVDSEVETLQRLIEISKLLNVGTDARTLISIERKLNSITKK